MVRPSEAFSPALLRGLVIHPEAPLQFDFIVDTGDDNLSGDALSTESQRMINYFLASLAIPEQDLWVNLSPVENDRIIPDTLIKTELGRDLLAEDYILKQLTASLIYPEDGLGKAFWQKVYDEAFEKFGVVDIPVDVFNKVWIVPERAAVIERGNTVYIAKAHLKVMLEADYVAMSHQKDMAESQAPARDLASENSAENNDQSSTADLTKQVLREVIVPAIEAEVNTGRNFAQLRQVFYALILAQWYQDVVKESVLNKVYSGRNKVAGIDLSDPQNKEIIYERYMAAYKQGVFNYIKEENDRLTNEPVPKKYFSGGIIGTRVERVPAGQEALSPRVAGRDPAMVSVKIEAALEPSQIWNSPERPLAIQGELQKMWRPDSGSFEAEDVRQFIGKYSAQVQAGTKKNPVQVAWPILKAIDLMDARARESFFRTVLDLYKDDLRENRKVPLIVDKILLANDYTANWVLREAPNMKGHTVYNFSAEVYPAEGGLGEVIQNKLLGDKEIGLDSVAVQPWYQVTGSGKTINYKTGMEFRSFEENFKTFWITMGDENGGTFPVKVQVAKAIDKNGATVYLYRDVQADGSSKYTKMLYNYNAANNPISKLQSMTFLIEASATLFYILERERLQEKKGEWRPAVPHANDGQLLPLLAVLQSRFGGDKVVRDIVPAGTTHTVFNSGDEGDIRTFLQNMLRISPVLFNAFRQGNGWGDNIDHTTGGLGVAIKDGRGFVAGVSDIHAKDMSPVHRLKEDDVDLLVAATNGAMPAKLERPYREEFEALQQAGMIPTEADFQRPTGEQNRLVKQAMRKRLNSLNLKTASGRPVILSEDGLLLGYIRRLVWEKGGFKRAFTRGNIEFLVKNGATLLLVGRDQGAPSAELKRIFMEIEADIAKKKAADPKTWSGDFFFLTEALPEVKPEVLCTFDLMVQDSDGPETLHKYGVPYKNTGAAEYSEEFPAGAYVAGGSFGPGVIVAQGILMRAQKRPDGEWYYENPGEGNTLTPQEDTPPSWQETVFAPLIRLRNEDPVKFYEGAAKTSWLIRIMEARITSAENARGYSEAEANWQENRRIDDETLDKFVAGLTDPRALKGVLDDGRNGANTPFPFTVFGKGEFKAEGLGLRNFLAKASELEQRFGYDALKHHYMKQPRKNGPDASDFQLHLTELFKGLRVEGLLAQWLERLDRSPALLVQKHVRLMRFLKDLDERLERAYSHRISTPEKVNYLLNTIGAGFSWYNQEGKIKRSGPGLAAFVDDYNALGIRSDVINYHNREKAADIIAYAKTLLESSPMLAPLKKDVQPDLDELSLLGDDPLELKVDVTKRVMQKLSQKVASLREESAHPPVVPEKEQAVVPDNAMANPGGIDVRDIGVDRQGELIPGVVSDQALEDMLMNASGVHGVIIGIMPIPDLFTVIGAPR